jgi:hypothetical protein
MALGRKRTVGLTLPAHAGESVMAKRKAEMLSFITSLAKRLRENGQASLADGLTEAGQFAWGSNSEFLHEVQMALKKVQLGFHSCLDAKDMSEIEAAISQIEEAFRSVGGA